MYWSLNNFLSYEKTRISYIDEHGVERNYIVDFTDELNKRIIEIKPLKNKNILRNILKEKYAKKWAEENGYEYSIIDETYFYTKYEILYNLFKNNKKILTSLQRLMNENKKD